MMQKKICFVLMPFKDEYRQVYDVVIKPTVEGMGMNCVRADDLNTQKNIMKELVEYIHKSEIIIADLTDMNPNVFYELGISHSLGKKTIMITQSIDKFIPFDLRAYRAIPYEMDFAGGANLKQNLKNAITALIESKTSHGNPVQDFLPSATIISPNNLEHFESAISHKTSVRNDLLEGINKIAEFARVTYGPKGHPVIISKKSDRPIFSKNIHHITKDIEVDNKVANAAIQLTLDMVREIKRGGVKTSIILTQSIYKESIKIIDDENTSFIQLKNGLNKILEIILNEIHHMSKPVNEADEIAEVAFVASDNNQTVGNLVVEAIREVGKNGIITVEESNSEYSTLKIADGIKFNSGYISPYFTTDPENMEADLKDAYILLCTNRISNMKDLLPILEQVAKMGKPIFIIAEDIEGEALATLVVNKLRGTLRVAAVKAPDFGKRRIAMLEDCAILTGGVVISADTDIKLESATISDLGKARRVIIDKGTTTIIGQDINLNRKKPLKSLAKRKSGIAVIQIGGLSEDEMKTNKENALNAIQMSQMALNEGIVPGGGIAYFRAMEKLYDLEIRNEMLQSTKIIKSALEQPVRQILKNAGLDDSAIIDEIKKMKGSAGYNVITGEYGDMFNMGIIEPTESTRIALENAMSLASKMLTGQIIDLKEEEKDDTDLREKYQNETV